MISTKQTSSQPDSSTSDTSDIGTPNIASTDRLIIGNPNAKATIVEYADFKCPNCAKFHETTGQQIRQEYIDSGLAKIEFRAFPIIGPDSARALRGAYCANQSSAFTNYHDDLSDFMWENYYKNGNYAVEIEDILTEKVLTDIATKAGANKQDFAKCIATDEMNKYIDRDLAASAKDGVAGTPTFIIAGQKIVRPLPFNNFKALIDIELR